MTRAESDLRRAKAKARVDANGQSEFMAIMSKAKRKEQARPSVPMSRSTRRQLHALDLVRCCRESIESAFAFSGDTIRPTLQAKIGGMERARRSCFRALTGGFDKLEVDPKEHREYVKSTLHLQQFIHDVWPDVVPTAEVLTVALSLVTMVYEESRLSARSRPTMERRERALAWGNLAEAVQDVIEVYCPNLSGIAVDKGAALAEMARHELWEVV